MRTTGERYVKGTRVQKAMQPVWKRGRAPVAECKVFGCLAEAAPALQLLLQSRAELGLRQRLGVHADRPGSRPPLTLSLRPLAPLSALTPLSRAFCFLFSSSTSYSPFLWDVNQAAPVEVLPMDTAQPMATDRCARAHQGDLK